MSDVGKSLLIGAQQALDYAKGKKSRAKAHKIEIPKEIDVKHIREDLKMSRKEFSEQFGFSLRTLEKWERHERTPEGPARAYLIVIARNPVAVKKALSR